MDKKDPNWVRVRIEKSLWESWDSPYIPQNYLDHIQTSVLL